LNNTGFSFGHYLALAGEDDWNAQRVPAYVEREFRRYLECGILAYGFARARCPDCGHDFLVAFSCKGRGLCPSCNARRMAETAAHLVDHVFPPLPVRQWVLSVPKRLRWYLERELRAVSAVLHILLRVIEAHRRRSSGGNAQTRFGAVSFIHRFGASLNRHVHYHCCVIDGVFEPAEEAGDIPQSVRFRPAAELTPEAVAAIAEQVRVRVLRWFARSGLIEADDVRDMLAWENSGFSLDAAVRVGAHERAGPERLLRYCARPPFALERLELLDAERVVYRLPKPQRDGTTALSLTPLALIDHLAAQLVYRLAAAQALHVLAHRVAQPQVVMGVEQAAEQPVPLAGVLYTGELKRRQLRQRTGDRFAAMGDLKRRAVAQPIGRWRGGSLIAPACSKRNNRLRHAISLSRPLSACQSHNSHSAIDSRLRPQSGCFDSSRRMRPTSGARRSPWIVTMI